MQVSILTCIFYRIYFFLLKICLSVKLESIFFYQLLYLSKMTICQHTLSFDLNIEIIGVLTGVYTVDRNSSTHRSLISTTLAVACGC